LGEIFNKLPVEEEEDDYFKQIETRHNKIENYGSQKIIPALHKDKDQTGTSKFANKFSENLRIRSYLLNTQNYHDFNISYNDTFRDVKAKLLEYISSNSKFKIKYHTVDGNEII
jgi:2-phosphoglycerate kinase